MSYSLLRFDVRDRIATVTINRPDKLNALNDALVAELGHAAAEIASRDDVGGAIITGAGPKAFVAGGDIGEMAKQGPFDGKDRALRGQAMVRAFETCGTPVIAAVNGFEMSLEDGLNLEANLFGLLATTADMREGLTAFVEKRDPKFTGR